MANGKITLPVWMVTLILTLTMAALTWAVTVKINESKIEQLQSDIEIVKPLTADVAVLKSQYGDIIKTLERMENKIDRHMERK